MPGSAAFSILIGVKDLASNRLRTVAREVGRIGDAAEAAGKRIKPLQDKLKGLEKTGESMRQAFLPGAAIAAGLGGTVAAFATVEDAQNRLKTNLMDVTGKVGPEYEQLLALANRLGTELPGSTMDMIEMFTALREQGVQTNVILGGMGEASAKFAVLMKVPFAEAATHVAKFSEAMGIADKDAVAFMDVLQRLKGAGGVNVTDLAETFKYSGASLKALKLQGMQAGKDVSAAIGMMATSSIEGSQAGTNFSMALSRMAEISHKLESKKIKEMVGPILDAKGIKLDFFDQGGNFVGIRGMIQELEKLRAVNPQEQLFVLSKLFGQEAARPLSVFINQGVKGFDEMNRRMQQQADMQTKIQAIMAGTKMRWETVTGTLANVIAKIGGVTAAGLGIPTLLVGINDALAKVDMWIAGHPQAAKAIMVVVAAVSALLLIIGSLGAVLAAASAATSWALGGWVRFGAGLKVVAGIVRAVGVAMLTNPVVAIAAGIAVAALLIYKYWGPIGGFFKRLWLGLKEGVKALQPFFAALASAVARVGRGVYASGLNLMRTFWLGVTAGLDRLRPIVSAVGAIPKSIIGFSRQIYAAGLSLLRMFWQGVTAGVNGLQPILDMAKAIPAEIMRIAPRLYTAGANILRSLWQGMKSMMDKPIAVMKEMATKMREYLPFSPAKVGPLKDIHRIKLVETIAATIKPGPMVKAMGAVAAATALAVTPAIPSAPGSGPVPGTKGMPALPMQSPGAAGGKTGAPGGSHITFAPVINVQGTTDAAGARSQVEQALKLSQAEFEKMLARAEANKRRKGFA